MANDMVKKTSVSILKPSLSAAASAFAIGSPQTAPEAPLTELQREVADFYAKQPKTPVKASSGLVPAGDVRLTANISEQHHMKLKIAAVQQKTTIGELIEQMVDKL